jgi:hypothetical protein
MKIRDVEIKVSSQIAFWEQVSSGVWEPETLDVMDKSLYLTQN